MPITAHSEFFREVTLRISSSLDVGEALSATLAYLQTVLPADEIGLYYYDEQRMAIYAVAELSTAERKVYDDEIPYLPLDEEGIAYVLRRMDEEQGSVIVLNRPEDDPMPQAFRQALARHKGNSLLRMPLTIQRSRLGFLHIAARGYGRYTEEHARLLSVVQMPIAIAMSNVRRYRETVRLQRILADENKALSHEIQELSGSHVVGAEFGLRNVMELVRQVAPLASPVLLMGETGSGKEVVANAIHKLSTRQHKPIIRVPCGSIPDSLLNSELFGHERGAFTGAVQTKRGRFERADGGTIFLDEIGELTPEAQVNLLRVLQEKEFERLGGVQTVSVDVRVIAATHRNLERMVREGTFREDLWFRLNVFPIFLPPLRQRKGDIPALVQFFLERKSREMGLGRSPQVAAGEMERLMAYDWPGNVRELQNAIERALIIRSEGGLRFNFIEQRDQSAPDMPAQQIQDNASTIAPLDEAITNHIRHALKSCHGRIEGPKGAAAILKIHPSTLRSKMKKLGIPLSG